MLLTMMALCIILILSAALGAFFALAKHPPVFAVTISIAPPGSQPVANVPPPPPIPESIVEYIEQESEEHARQTRKLRARGLYAEMQDWDAVFRTLQREDNLSQG